MFIRYHVALSNTAIAETAKVRLSSIPMISHHGQFLWRLFIMNHDYDRVSHIDVGRTIANMQLSSRVYLSGKSESLSS
jgi:hypothetical protein